MTDHAQSLTTTPRWGLFECTLSGPSTGNPFTEVQLTATFTNQHRTLQVEGFYDGEGRYRIRFMPDEIGEWHYVTASNCADLHAQSGVLQCVAPEDHNHGPVQVADSDHFAYADGTPYLPFGTTCYAWTHQSPDLRETTLQTLAQAPFNKIRMCVFPKNYPFNEQEPVAYPFEGSPDSGWDFTRFNPAFFQTLDQAIARLLALGIEADLILFHPYDKGRWGFDRMQPEEDDRYLRYVLARLSAYRNIWWSIANEYDFMKEKSLSDWDRYFRVVQTYDPYQHLRSIHNGTRMYDFDSLKLYDYSKPWVTHVSLQHWDMHQTPVFKRLHRKPVVMDEFGYEGDLHRRWGNLTGEELTKRIWECAMYGGYPTHGETFVHPEGIIWWSHGGQLHGDSPARIGWLRNVMEQAPAAISPVNLDSAYQTLGVDGHYYLQYYGNHRPAFVELVLPEDGEYALELLDTWNMTVTPVPGTCSGACNIALPGTPYMAVRLKKLH